MKKKFYILCLVSILVACGWVLASCSSQLYSQAKNLVSEVRYDYYQSSDEVMEANLITGMREQEYMVDGVHTTPIPFGVLSFMVSDDAIDDNSVAYSLKVADKDYSGTLEKNPYDNSYVADIGELVEGGSDIEATITSGDFTHSLKLNSVITDEWKVDHEKALKIATEELKDELKQMMQDKVLKAEVYVRIITNTDLDSDEYYWYVNFVSSNGNTSAVVIDPISKEILARKG